jgi:hypothetical protein
MAIKVKKAYSIICDKCEEIFEHPMSGDTMYGNKGDIIMYAGDYGWIRHEGKDYCPHCHKRHDDEDLVTILTDPPITVEC